MVEIEKRFIIKSKEILDQYTKLVIELQDFEDAVSSNKTVLENLKEKINKLELSEEPMISKESQLFLLLSEYDKEISKIQNIVNPHLKLMDNLKKDSANLYKLIKDKYPGYTDKELQQQIAIQIEKLESEI